jgi:hypothetical protein
MPALAKRSTTACAVPLALSVRESTDYTDYTDFSYALARSGVVAGVARFFNHEPHEQTRTIRAAFGICARRASGESAVTCSDLLRFARDINAMKFVLFVVEKSYRVRQGFGRPKFAKKSV